MVDFSSRPHRLRSCVPEATVARTIALRRKRWTGKHIALATAVSPASLSRVLSRAGLSRFKDIDPGGLGTAGCGRLQGYAAYLRQCQWRSMPSWAENGHIPATWCQRACMTQRQAPKGLMDQAFIRKDRTRARYDAGCRSQPRTQAGDRRLHPRAGRACRQFASLPGVHVLSRAPAFLRAATARLAGRCAMVVPAVVDRRVRP